MNLKQPYEQLIAGKLRQLRGPDADASWQQMKRLLDDDEDKGAGGKRPPGNNGWWRIGLVAVVLSAGFWLYVNKNTTPEVLAANNTATAPQQAEIAVEKNKENNSNKNQTAAIDNSTTLKDSIAENTIVNNDAETGNATTGKSVAASTQKNSTIVVVNTTEPGNAVGKNGTRIANKKNNIHTQTDLTGPEPLVRESKTGTNKLQSMGSNVLAASKNNNIDPIGYNAVNHSYSHTKPQGKKGAAIKNKNTKNSGAEIDDAAAAAQKNFSLVKPTVTAKEKSWFERLTELRIDDPVPAYNTALVAGDSINGSRDVNNLLNSETKKDIAKAQRDKAIELLDKKDKKGLHLNLGNLFKPFSLRPAEVDPWWGAGIAVNGGIMLGAQNRYPYNMNAKSGILTDFIPSPYLQYHLNNYVYLQTELNFVSPQYTPQLLVYRQNNDISVSGGGNQGMSQQKSIYVQKMYYFNWPVSLHYSPVNNLFLSAGIQFSSFQSGLASIEEKQYVTALGPDNPNSTINTVLKFRDDSIAAKIAPNEWRWQVGAEYYWNRFSIGLRYNQSFKNSINTTPSHLLPATVNRNHSLQFSVRYNLFESRSKNSVPKNQ